MFNLEIEYIKWNKMMLLLFGLILSPILLGSLTQKIIILKFKYLCFRSYVKSENCDVNICINSSQRKNISNKGVSWCIAKCVSCALHALRAFLHSSSLGGNIRYSCFSNNHKNFLLLWIGSLPYTVIQTNIIMEIFLQN